MGSGAVNEHVWEIKSHMQNITGQVQTKEQQLTQFLKTDRCGPRNTAQEILFKEDLPYLH